MKAEEGKPEEKHSARDNKTHRRRKRHVKGACEALVVKESLQVKFSQIP